MIHANVLGQTMPVIFRDGGLRYYFFQTRGFRASRDIFTSRAAAGTQKSGWSRMLPIAESYGFKSSELARIIRAILERRILILKALDDHFGNGRPF